MNSLLLRKQAATGYPNEIELLAKGGDRLFEVDSLRKPGSRMLVAIPEDGGMGDADYPVYDPDNEKVKFQHANRFSKKFKDAVKTHMKSEVEEAETPKEEQEAVNSPALRTGSAKAAAKCPTCGSEVKCNCPPPPRRYRVEPHPKGHAKIVHAAGLGSCGCADPGCPVHKGSSACPFRGRTFLYRVDMEDHTGTPMCLQCATDAMDSGLFRQGTRNASKVAAPRQCPFCRATNVQPMGVFEGQEIFDCPDCGRHFPLDQAVRVRPRVPAMVSAKSAATVHDIKPLVDELRQVDPAGHMDKMEKAMSITGQLATLAKQVGARDLLLAARHYLEVLEKMDRYGLPGGGRYETGVDPMPPRLLRTHERAWKQLEAAFVHFVR